MSSDQKCKNCGSVDIEVDPGRGDAVCTNCGVVLEDNIIVSEVQFQEGAHGTSNAIGQFVSVDSKGGGSRMGASFHTGSGLESREATLHNANKNIKCIGGTLNLKQNAIDVAYGFFRLALTAGLTRGRRRNHVYGACIYLSCRTCELPHLLIDISDALDICCYELGRTYMKLAQALHINIPSMDPSLYILRFASKLEFGPKTQQVTNTALRLIQRMKRDNIHTGRRPAGLCGAALLIAARLNEFSRSIGDIVKVVKVHESTMRKRLVEFGDTPSSALTLEEFMTVDLEEEQDPPAFKAARRKDKERLERSLPEEAYNLTELNELQKEIEEQLEQTKVKSRMVPKSTARSEEAEMDKFIRESSKETISLIIKDVDEIENVPTKELGPDLESLGLPSSMEDTSNALQPETSLDIDLTFEDVDDDELDSYILTEQESKVKQELWEKVNADYLKKQKDKEERLQKEREEGKPEKKPRKRQSKRGKIGPAHSAAEAIAKVIQEKKVSSKINYDVLKNLNSLFAPPDVEDKTEGKASKRKEPEESTELPPAKKTGGRKGIATASLDEDVPIKVTVQKEKSPEPIIVHASEEEDDFDEEEQSCDEKNGPLEDSKGDQEEYDSEYFEYEEYY